MDDIAAELECHQAMLKEFKQNWHSLPNGPLKILCSLKISEAEVKLKELRLNHMRTILHRKAHLYNHLTPKSLDVKLFSSKPLEVVQPMQPTELTFGSDHTSSESTKTIQPLLHVQCVSTNPLHQPYDSVSDFINIIPHNPVVEDCSYTLSYADTTITKSASFQETDYQSFDVRSSHTARNDLQDMNIASTFKLCAGLLHYDHQVTSILRCLSGVVHSYYTNITRQALCLHSNSTLIYAYRETMRLNSQNRVFDPGTNVQNEFQSGLPSD